MKSQRCQHDLLARGSTIVIEGHWSVGIKARCMSCNSAADINKRGRPKLDTQNLPHKDAVRFADGRYGCERCGAYVTEAGRLQHAKGCDMEFSLASDAEAKRE
jgi:hypothetical protein